MRKIRRRLNRVFPFCFGLSIDAATIAFGVAAGLFSVSASPAAMPYIWKSVAIHGGGFVAGIITDPATPGRIYARTDVGGAYRWNPSAKSWVPLTDWISQSDGLLMGCESIAIDPSASDRIYMALGMYTNSWGKNGAIVRSADGGKTFERTNMPFKMGGNCGGRSMGERLAVDPNDGRVLFFGSRAAGLWKSVDQAKTWENVPSFPEVATSASAAEPGEFAWPLGIAFVKFDRRSGHSGSPTPVVYAGVSTQETSLFRSTDGGTTWAAVPNQPVGLRPNHMVMSPAGISYISYGDQAGPNGMENGALWAFNPDGDRWIDITPVKPSQSDHFGYGAITIDARHPATLMACSMDRWGRGDTVFRTTDGGKNWTSQMVGKDAQPGILQAPDAPWGLSMKPHWLGDIEIDPFDSDHVLFETGFGIWDTHEASALDSGGTPHWVFNDRGLEETVPEELVSPPAGPPLISVIGDFDGFTHDNLDVSPEHGRHQKSIGSTSGLDFAEKMPSRVVRAGGRGEGFYSDDSGHTWTQFSNRPRGARTGGSIAIASDGKTIVWQCGAASTYRSTDLGKTWQACKALPRPLQVIADRADPNRFYALDGTSGQLLASDDAAASFRPIGPSLPAHEARIRAVPEHPGDLWLTAENRLYHTTDGGQSFAKISTVNKADRIGFGKSAPGGSYPAIFMSGVVNRVEGLFRSDNGGQSWSRLDDDQHHFGSLDIVIGDPRVFGRVYLGTGGRGIVYGDIGTARE